MLITEDQKKFIIKIGYSRIGQKYPRNYKCHDFIRDIYKEVGVSTDFNNEYPKFSLSEIWEEKAVGHVLFLRRKETKISKRITHMGIIFPNKQLLHYSRWMKEDMIYQVFASSFDEVFKIYDFVEV